MSIVIISSSHVQAASKQSKQSKQSVNQQVTSTLSNKHQRYFLGVEMAYITRLSGSQLLEVYSKLIKRKVERLEDLTSAEANYVIKYMRGKYR